VISVPSVVKSLLKSHSRARLLSGRFVMIGLRVGLPGKPPAPVWLYRSDPAQCYSAVWTSIQTLASGLPW
jgi:hypothetical protein